MDACACRQENLGFPMLFFNESHAGNGERFNNYSELP